MRFYNQSHRFYCGVDLHARTLSVHILDAEGETVFAKTIPASPTRPNWGQLRASASRCCHSFGTTES